jgi:hypothetical protein
MSSLPQKVRKSTGLTAHKVDYVASLLMSLLIVFGALVFLLFIYWLTMTFSFKAGGIVVEEERLPGRGDHAAGFERDIEPPGAEEVEVLAEPTLQSSLEAVSDVASTVAATLESVNSNADATVAGSGKGDSRPPGPLGEGDDIVPRYERWDLKFQSKGLKPYAEQIDFYKIELACMGGQRTIDFAINVSGAPQKRSDPPEVENKRQRLYFMWRTDTPLKQFDTQLLGQAGVKTQGRLIVKFIPKELEQQLAEIETVYYRSKGKKSIREVAKTIFESQATSNGYQFVVIDQLYRN